MGEFNNLIRSLAENFHALTKLVETMQKKVGSESKQKPAPVKKAPAKRVPAEKIAVRPTRKATHIKTRKGPATRKRIKPEGGATILETIQRVIENNPGIGLKGIQENTGFDARQIQNTVFRLRKLGTVKTEGRGMYYPVERANIAEAEQVEQEKPGKEQPEQEAEIVFLAEKRETKTYRPGL